jgi:hypothetical protein
MSTRLGGLLLLCLALGGRAAMAEQDSDLGLIPQGIEQLHSSPAETSEASDANQRLYLEDAIVASILRSGLPVPVPPPASTDWEDRLFFDLRRDWRLDDQLNVTLSGRFNLRAESDIPIADHENVVVEWREAYASWRPLDGTYLDIGRINLKSGVALGFNPTDFFKTRAVIDPLSVDPSVLREDRLGTVMAVGQHIWRDGAVLVAVAPKLSNPSAISINTNLPAVNPSLDRTNGEDRVLIKGNVSAGDDFSPEFLVYREGARTVFGANFTESIGQSIVAYAEWAGGERSSLIDQALAYGRLTGTLPSGARSLLSEDGHRSFQTQLSAGASYTTDSKITFNLEYHFDQDAFSRRDWNAWFRDGAADGRSAGLSAELWYLRSYALDQQEPISQNALFLRADWVDAVYPRLELIWFINADLRDGSSLVQVEADYSLSNDWTIGALVIGNLGSKRSDFGSLPQGASALFKLARYF